MNSYRVRGAGLVLSKLQSTWQTAHDCSTASLKVINETCAAIFINLAKAFNNMKHMGFIDKLGCIAVSGKCISWISKYLATHVCEITAFFSLSYSCCFTWINP